MEHSRRPLEGAMGTGSYQRGEGAGGGAGIAVDSKPSALLAEAKHGMNDP